MCEPYSDHTKTDSKYAKENEKRIEAYTKGNHQTTRREKGEERGMMKTGKQ